jgi:hypothetical protein
VVTKYVRAMPGNFWLTKMPGNFRQLPVDPSNGQLYFSPLAAAGFFSLAVRVFL